jgi:hypothetical protein
MLVHGDLTRVLDRASDGEPPYFRTRRRMPADPDWDADREMVAHDVRDPRDRQ